MSGAGVLGKSLNSRLSWNPVRHEIGPSAGLGIGLPCDASARTRSKALSEAGLLPNNSSTQRTGAKSTLPSERV